MTVAIVSLCARGNGEQIEVCAEIRQEEQVQRERFCISAADCADLKLKKGEITPEEYDRLAETSARHFAKRKAMQCLMYGNCSKRRMVQKLCAKGVQRALAEQVAQQLEEEGYLNGAEDALREAERDLSKGWGERRIICDLRAKGYTEEQIKKAVCRLRKTGAAGAERCADQIRRRWGGLPKDPKERQRAISALQRLGFSLTEIREGAQSLEEA